MAKFTAEVQMKSFGTTRWVTVSCDARNWIDAKTLLANQYPGCRIMQIMEVVSSSGSSSSPLSDTPLGLKGHAFIISIFVFCALIGYCDKNNKPQSIPRNTFAVENANATVTGNNVNVRDEPGTHGDVIAKMNGGRVNVVGYNDNGWREVQTQDESQKGWINVQFVKMDSQ